MSIFQPRWKTTKYSDTRTDKADPERNKQPELDWYMEHYALWRSLFNGTALEEKLSITTDLSTDTEQNEYRWPVRFNLIRSFCLLYAGFMWGRGTTAAKADHLFDIRVNSKVPGRPGPESTDQAKRLQDILTYWWSYWFHTLRPHAATQQWAGGTVVKVAWNPFSPGSVYGIQLQSIQPEHFYPIWNPLNFEEIYGVKIKFFVSKQVAIQQYGITTDELKDYSENSDIPVEESWDRWNYRVSVGKGGTSRDDPGIIARIVGPDGRTEKMEGKNPYVSPRTQFGVIPFVYIPRIRTGGFFGDSLAYSLEGLQQETNKTLADYGDALTRGSHPPFGISDYYGAGSKTGVIMVPRHGALNLGHTPATRVPPKIHTFPSPEVPEQTDAFADRLLSLSEVVTGLTPAARGSIDGGGSGFSMAMGFLPTTTVIDWQRGHWSAAITGFGGINEIVETILFNKARELPSIPTVDPGMFSLRQEIEYRPILPRDRTEIIDEVVRLATAKAVSPQEWLKRLGDIEDLDEELMRLLYFLTWYAQIEAAVAGRSIKIKEPVNPENPAQALPQVAGQTEKPKSQQPATQPEGQTIRSVSDGR